VNPAESIAWLFSLHRFGMKLGLENIATLTAALGRPQDRFRPILVAGTNGKGSTAAMLHGILCAAGYRSGLYTSPHLVHTEERIRIGEVDIAPDELAGILSEIRERIEALVASNEIGAYPTFFEVITAAAFVAFARAQLEVAVLEVGLGGRLDATNVADPVLSIITSIDYDHQEQLGPTLTSIAREKAGILRAGVPALIGDLDPEALAAVNERAEALGTPVTAALQGSTVESAPSNPASRTAQTLSVTTPLRSYPSISCPLPGRHQRINALLAVRAAEMLAEFLGRPAADKTADTLHSPDTRNAATFTIDAASITGGIASARWPGRLEWIEGAPPLLLDGAHNPAGCRALADYLSAAGVRPVLLFAAMRDKEFEPMLALLLPRISGAVFTSPPMERAAEPARLLETARRLYRGIAPAMGPAMEMSPIHNPAERLLASDSGRFVAEPGVAAALAQARRLAGPRGVVLAAGSLFLVGAVKEVLLGLPVRAGDIG
jgi:dihydrofolate synthase/folylpolyglutamate synthase